VIGADILDNASDADAFIYVKGQDFSVEAREWTDDSGFDLVFDCVGGPTLEWGLKALRIGGRQVAMTSPGDGRVTFNLRDFYHKRLRLIGVDSFGLTGPQIAKTMDSLRPGFEGGHLRPPQIRTWPLEQAVDAYAAVDAGKSGSKHVLVPRSSTNGLQEQERA
jgi:NADPH:quinone reductase-like Zn-dependent oxidoreductase